MFNVLFLLSSDGKVISHCSSNTHDFLYPAIPQYYGPGREILLYKTARFKPIRITVSQNWPCLCFGKFLVTTANK